MRYRVYFVDEVDHVHEAFDLRAECAADAVRESEALAGGAPPMGALEVWEVSTTAAWDRLICRHKAKGRRSRTRPGERSASARPGPSSPNSASSWPATG